MIARTTSKKQNPEQSATTANRIHLNKPRITHSFPSSFHYPLIQRKPLCPCDGGCPRCVGVIQPKLTIDQPNDKYEQEADRVADQVMRMPEPKQSLVNGHSSLVQRQTGCTGPTCNEEEETIQAKPIGDQITPLDYVQRQEETIPEEEEEEEPVQAKSLNNKSPPVIANLQNRIQSLKGGGQPLFQSTRAFFEPRFGQDFSDVRVHTCNSAIQISSGLKAQALTYKNNIYFNQSKYSPETSSGMRLLAHELTHVVQQQGNVSKNKPERIDHYRSNDESKIKNSISSADVSIQRSCGSAAIGEPTGCTFNDKVVTHPRYFFKVNCDEFKPGNEDDLRRDAGKIANGETVEIYGLASWDGSATYNRNLSCARALAAKRVIESVLVQRGVTATLLVYNHGRTKSDAELQRSVVVYRRTPSPPTPPTPSTPPTPPISDRICGPDVSTEVTRIWSKIQTDFRSWNFSEKLSACRYLIQPIVPGSGSSGYTLNNNAFDTLGLYQGSADWLRLSPYHPPCAVPGTCAPANSNSFNSCHENDKTCSNTVKVGSGCWLSGTPNYGTYGIMMRLCWDWTLPLKRLPPFNYLRKVFSLSSTKLIVTAYKLYKGDGPGPPCRWAAATWAGGPAARVSGSNRLTCQPTCSVSYPHSLATGYGKQFDYVWEPVKPR